jgi:hypothetical protein
MRRENCDCRRSDTIRRKNAHRLHDAEPGHFGYTQEAMMQSKDTFCDVLVHDVASGLEALKG